MPFRTYLPTLYRIIKVVCEYTVRYDRQIRDNLPPETISAYEAFKVACEVFLALIPLTDEVF
jgi:hypothetical protein